jgi:hypothetical protein
MLVSVHCGALRARFAFHHRVTSLYYGLIRNPSADGGTDTRACFSVYVAVAWLHRQVQFT